MSKTPYILNMRDHFKGRKIFLSMSLEPRNWEAKTMEEESTELFDEINRENTRSVGKFQ